MSLIEDALQAELLRHEVRDRTHTVLALMELLLENHPSLTHTEKQTLGEARESLQKIYNESF